MWQHIQTIIDQKLHQNMEDQYKKLNKKLDKLTNNNNKNKSTQKTTQFQHMHLLEPIKAVSENAR
jgi:hypothetical protein